MSSRCVIVHNHPIHYKHLLFTALAKRGLNFEVLFTGAFSQQRLENHLPLNQEYQYQIGFDGPYERVPPQVAATFVWRSLTRVNPEAVIISGYYDVAAWTAWTWAQFHGAKRILWAESNEFDFPRHFLKELPKRLFVASCDLAHVYGSSNAAYVKKLGMPSQRIFVKRAVADTQLFFDRKDVDDRPADLPKELLYVGRFAKEKNLEFLLRALASVRLDRNKPGIILSLVGYGPLEKDLRALTEKLSLGNMVRFPGKAIQAKLPEIYRKADAFVLPSTYEPWGLVVNEAMLCRLPIILSTQCGCAADLCRPNTGWSFSPWDQDRLTELIEFVAATPRDKLREMGKAGAKIALEYSPENSAEVVSDSIAQVMGRRDLFSSGHHVEK